MDTATYKNVTSISHQLKKKKKHKTQVKKDLIFKLQVKWKKKQEKEQF